MWVAHRLVSSSVSFGHEVGVEGGGQELGGPGLRTVEGRRALSAEVQVASRLVSPRFFLGNEVGVEGGFKGWWM